MSRVGGPGVVLRVPISDESTDAQGSLEAHPPRPSAHVGSETTVRGVDPPERRTDGFLGRIAFWLAVVLPMVYVPLLFVPPAVTPPFSLLGLRLDLASVAFFVLVGVHLLTLFAGHAHTLRR